MFSAVRVDRRFLAGVALLGLALITFLGLTAAERRAQASLVAGRIILLDPGHGGVDPGAVGSTGVLEKDVVLAIALHLRDYLQQAGATVVLTRYEDRDISGYDDPSHPDRYRRDLYRRAEIIESSNADAFVSIHANALSIGSARGAQTFYRPDALGANKRLASELQRALVTVTGQANRGLSTDIHQLVLNRATMPAATVEVGFLSNPSEERLLAQSDQQQKIAWALFTGLTRYFAQATLPAPASSSGTDSPSGTGSP